MVHILRRRVTSAARWATLVTAALLLWLPSGGAAWAADPCCDDCIPPVGDMLGAEDFELDLRAPGGPRLLVSSEARRSDDTDPGPSGGLYAIPITSEGLGIPRLLLDRAAGCPLRPHGISLVADGSAQLLFVINHSRPADDGTGACVLPRSGPKNTPALHQVLRFRVHGDLVTLEGAPLAAPELWNPNDVAATGPNDVFVTNTPLQSILRAALEYLRLWVSSDVVHWDGERWSVVTDRVRYPNGVLATRERLWVASSLERRILVYDRTGNGFTQNRTAAIPVPSGLDNLLWAVDDDGTRTGDDMYVAGHPRLWDFIAHARDHMRASPSEIFLVRPGAARPARLVHRSEGVGIRAASAGLVFRNHLYMGQVFEPGIAVCRCRPCVGGQE